jgi:23S rRNA (pseudouridine1915-N3)-methyltransferase
MRIELICPEVKKLSMAKTAVERYIPRANRFTPCVLNEFKTEKNGDASYKVLKEEAEVLKKIEAQDFVILLDERGKILSTAALSLKIQSLKDQQGIRKLVLIIGGPYGVSDKIKKRADMALRLSDLTYNAEVAIVVLAEQIYRTLSLIAGHPYHNE